MTSLEFQVKPRPGPYWKLDLADDATVSVHVSGETGGAELAYALQKEVNALPRTGPAGAPKRRLRVQDVRVGRTYSISVDGAVDEIIKESPGLPLRGLGIVEKGSPVQDNVVRVYMEK